MGIVSEPWGEGKGLVATHYRDTGTGVDRGPGEAVRASGGPAETRGASGTRRADAREVQGWGRDLARPEDSDDAQAPAWHTGHCPMSTPVKRRMRVATGSGPASAVGA